MSDDEFSDVTPPAKKQPRQTPTAAAPPRVGYACCMAACCGLAIVLAISLIASLARGDGDDDDDTNRVFDACQRLARPWPADAVQCPPRAYLDTLVDTVFGAALSMPPGYQLAYYSPRCGLYTRTEGVRVNGTLANGDPLPLGDVSASLLTLALMRALRDADDDDARSALPSYDTPIGGVFPSLFDGDTVRFRDLVLARRNRYANIDGDCAPSMSPLDALLPVDHVVNGTSITPEYMRVNTSETALALVGARGPAAAACEWRTVDAALLALALERLGTSLERQVEQRLVDCRRTCSLGATFRCAEHGLDMNAMGRRRAGEWRAPSGERATLTGRQCTGSALDVLKVWHAAYDNGALRGAERVAFDESFIAETTAGERHRLFACNESERPGPLGFVRLPAALLADDATRASLDVSLGRTSIAVRYAAHRSLFVLLTNGDDAVETLVAMARALPLVDPVDTSTLAVQRAHVAALRYRLLARRRP